MLNFYIDNMRSSALTFKIKSGIFVKDKYTPLLQGIINLILSLWFVKLWELTGVLFATTLSILSIGFWQFPRLCYKYTFKKPLWNYFKKYILYTSLALTCTLISSFICRNIEISNLFLKVVINGVISLGITSSIYFLCLFRTAQFQQLKLYINVIFNRGKS